MRGLFCGVCNLHDLFYFIIFRDVVWKKKYKGIQKDSVTTQPLSINENRITQRKTWHIPRSVFFYPYCYVSSATKGYYVSLPLRIHFYLGMKLVGLHCLFSSAVIHPQGMMKQRIWIFSEVCLKGLLTILPHHIVTHSQAVDMELV